MTVYLNKFTIRLKYKIMLLHSTLSVNSVCSYILYLMIFKDKLKQSSWWENVTFQLNASEYGRLRTPR